MPAPQFVVMHRGDEGEENKASGAGAEGGGAAGAEGGGDSRVGAQIENLVNDLLRSFMNVFDGREFLRM